MFQLIFTLCIFVSHGNASHNHENKAQSLWWATVRQREQPGQTQRDHASRRAAGLGWNQRVLNDRSWSSRAEWAQGRCPPDPRLADGTCARLLSTQWPVRRWQVDGCVTLRVRRLRGASDSLSQEQSVRSHPRFRRVGSSFWGTFDLSP